VKSNRGLEIRGKGYREKMYTFGQRGDTRRNLVGGRGEAGKVRTLISTVVTWGGLFRLSLLGKTRRQIGRD